MGSSRRALWVALALLPCLLGIHVYHTEQEALHVVFPEATSIEPRTFVLDDAERARVTDEIGRPGRDHLAVFFRAEKDGSLLGHAIVLSEKGKSLPFRFLVSIRPEGAVDQVVLLEYREPRGDEISNPTFRAQYRGKTLADPIRRGEDIRNITGATISVDALDRGVRRALALYHVLVAGQPSAQRGAAEGSSSGARRTP